MGFTAYEKKVIDELHEISKSLNKIASVLEKQNTGAVDVNKLATLVEERIQAACED